MKQKTYDLLWYVRWLVLTILVVSAYSACSLSAESDVLPNSRKSPVPPVDEWDKQLSDTYFSMILIQINATLMDSALDVIMDRNLDFQDYVDLVNTVENNCVVVDIQRQNIVPPDFISSQWDEAVNVHLQTYDVTLQMTSGYKLSPKDALESTNDSQQKIDEVLLSVEQAVEDKYGYDKQELAERRSNVIQNALKDWLEKNNLNNP